MHVPSLEENKMKNADFSEKVNVSSHKVLETCQDDQMLKERKTELIIE
jgi:hypothetical protein